MKKRFSLSRLLIFVIIALELSLFLYLFTHNRMVVHDTFLRFSMQYYMLNHTAIYHDIPHWIPYICHGSSSFFWFGIAGCSSFFTNALFYLGPLIKYFSFPFLFYFTTFIDKILFLIGVWLLSKRYYSSLKTVFFVATAVFFSAIWTEQIYFNFYFYYLLPLILYLIHLFLDTGHWKYFFFAINFLFLQTVGNLIYFLPVVTFIIT